MRTDRHDAAHSRFSQFYENTLKKRQSCPAHVMKAYRGSRGIAPLILNFTLFIPCIIGNYLATRNQQNAQVCSFDIHTIMTMYIATCFEPLRTIIKESNQSKAAQNKLATFVCSRRSVQELGSWNAHISFSAVVKVCWVLYTVSWKQSTVYTKLN